MRTWRFSAAAATSRPWPPASRRTRKPRPWPGVENRVRTRRSSRPSKRPSRRGPSSSKEDPQSRRHRADLAASQHSIGQILADLGRLVEAEKTLKDALKVRETLAGEEPKNVRYRLDIGWTLMALSMVHWKAMRLDQADREWTTALRGMETAVRDEPEDSPSRNELPSAWIQVAEKLLLLGLWEEADELLQRALSAQPGKPGFH